MHITDNNEIIVFSGDGEREPILCTAAGVTSPETGYSRDYYPASEYIFEYVTRGSGYIETALGEYAISEGMLTAARQGAKFSIRSDTTLPLESVFVRMSGKTIGRLFDFFEIDGVFTKHANVLDIFLEIHAKLEEMDKNAPSDTYAHVLSLLFKMLSIANKQLFFPADEGKKSLAERVRDCIDANIYTDISLDEVAEKIGISKIHVIRVFKQKYGMPPMQYMMSRRIDIAKSLLTNTVMPIHEIAELLRFSNAQHFSGKFRSAVGCTPNKYRKDRK